MRLIKGGMLVNELDICMGVIKKNSDGYHIFKVKQTIEYSMHDLVDIARITQELNTGEPTTIGLK